MGYVSCIPYAWPAVGKVLTNGSVSTRQLAEYYVAYHVRHVFDRRSVELDLMG